MAGESGRPPAIFLTGPTASGKTALALELAERLPVEIISVDSAQVYRGLDIGSAKPEPGILARYPHHLVDIRDPSDPYSAALFAEDAARLMAAISGRGRIPLLVGGTMLYFRVLRESLSPLPSANPQVRWELEREAEIDGWPAMHRQLQAVDPETARALHPNHSHRIQRALEVFRVTGTPLSTLIKQEGRTAGAGRSVIEDYRAVQIAVSPVDRGLLHRRIETRFLHMLERGLVREVENLRRRPDLHPALPALRSVGYRQVWEFLSGEYEHAEMVARATAATRQLAKRQYTWLNKWHGLHWLYTETDRGESLQFRKIVDNCLKILQKAPIYIEGTR